MLKPKFRKGQKVQYKIHGNMWGDAKVTAKRETKWGWSYQINNSSAWYFETMIRGI